MISEGLGPVDYVTNEQDRKKYTISTYLNRLGWHETAICSVATFLRRVPAIFGAVSLVTPGQVAFDDPVMAEASEEKHGMFVWVTDVTEADMNTAHGIVSDVVRSAPKQDWFKRIVERLVPYLKSVGRFVESQENEIKDFAQRHTLIGPARMPMWKMRDQGPLKRSD